MKGNLARALVSLAGGCMVAGVAGLATASPLESDQVDITVDIAPRAQEGALTLTVAAPSTNLTEVPPSEPGQRQFDGTLPTATVTDDREQAPPGVYWYVVGQSSDFVSDGAAEIPASQFGWRPELLSASFGQVNAGDEVLTVLDPPSHTGNNQGLVSDELLVGTINSGWAHLGHSWDATADLFLKTSSDVEPGVYTALVTLSLWEIEY